MTFKTLMITSVITATGLSFTACTTTHPVPPKPQVKKVPAAPVKSEAQKHQEYKVAMSRVKKDIKADPNYKKLGLKQEDGNWFRDLTYDLWDKKISREQFIANGLKKRPANLYEFNVIADGLLSS